MRRLRQKLRALQHLVPRGARALEREWGCKGCWPSTDAMHSHQVLPRRDWEIKEYVELSETSLFIQRETKRFEFESSSDEN